MRGAVEIFILAGSEEVVIEYLGKGSVIGSNAVLAREPTKFGMRAV